MRLHFDEAGWERIERDYKAWWAHQLDRPLVQVMSEEREPGVSYPEVHSFYTNYPLDVPAEQVIEDVTRNLEAKRYYGDAFPKWWPNFGPGIIAGFLGARVNSVPDTAWFEPVEPKEAKDIHFVYQSDNPWWLRIKEMTRVAVETWGDMVQVCHTDLGGNLDVLASFRTTQNLLTDLYDAPEEVERLVGEITNLWIQYYDELDAIIRPTCRGTMAWAPIWSRERTYMLQCDFSYMISPDMFERFVLPDLIACCDNLENGFYHLDGPGALPHLDLLLSIPRLRGIQWIPGAGVRPEEEWLDVLKRIVDANKLCQIHVSAEGARTVVKNLGGKGFLLYVWDSMSADEAEAFLNVLSREDISQK